MWPIDRVYFYQAQTLILETGFGVLLAEEDIICSFSHEPALDLECDSGEVIDVIATKVGYVHDYTSCGDIMKRMRVEEEVWQCLEDIPLGLSRYYILQ